MTTPSAKSASGRGNRQACAKAPLKLVILGDGPFRQELLDYGVAEDVLQPGFTPNPYPFFARAKAFALPSYSEGLSYVLLEAMACGTAAISSRCKWGAEEILEDGRHGLLYPVDDTQALAARLKEVLESPATSATRAARALKRVDDFSLDRVLPKLADRILGGNRQATNIEAQFDRAT